MCRKIVLAAAADLGHWPVIMVAPVHLVCLHARFYQASSSGIYGLIRILNSRRRRRSISALPSTSPMSTGSFLFGTKFLGGRFNIKRPQA